MFEAEDHDVALVMVAIATHDTTPEEALRVLGWSAERIHDAFSRCEREGLFVARDAKETVQ